MKISKFTAVILSTAMVLSTSSLVMAADSGNEHLNEVQLEYDGENEEIMGSNPSSRAFTDEYAYSIGIKDKQGLNKYDDFTGNVKYAATTFGLIPRITNSYVNTAPSVTYLKGKNPSGIPRLGSSIVFLNGHANYDNMAFDDFDTGVYYRKHYTSSSTGINYAGIESTNMENVDLIHFAGCSTAEGRENLAVNAYYAGADTSIGLQTALTPVIQVDRIG